MTFESWRRVVTGCDEVSEAVVADERGRRLCSRVEQNVWKAWTSREREEENASSVLQRQLLWFWSGLELGKEALERRKT
jgi:hypothetical protein